MPLELDDMTRLREIICTKKKETLLLLLLQVVNPVIYYFWVMTGKII
jgi:hypothetical protein